jgi:hypothetical protein
MQEVNWKTHGDMIEVLESPTRRKLIVMPRGTFKSSLAGVAYPIQRLMNDPNDRILIDSEVFINSKNHLRAIKAHTQSAHFKELFGDWRSESNWADGSITVSNRTKPLKESSITCGGIGTVKVGQHYDCIIFDDLNSNNNSLTPEGCQKVIDHYRMSIALLEPNGTIVVVGTRYSANDLIQFILDNEVNIDQKK